MAEGEKSVANLSHRNGAEECPDWAVPSRRWAWRIAVLACALFWAILLVWLFGGFALSA